MTGSRIGVREPVGDAGEELVAFAASTRLADLPAQTVAMTKRLVLDTLGAAVAGAEAPSVPRLRELVLGWGGRPDAHLVGSGQAVPAPLAALHNATAARALELDEVHEVALVHSAATIVPVALAVAEQHGDAEGGGVAGAELLAAVAVGIELCIRLALAADVPIGGSGHVPRVMSLSTQAPTLAGALVAARLRGLDPDGMADALGVAYAGMAGNLQMLLEGSRVVRVMQGVSAQTAVQAAELAAAGIGGPRRVLEGRAGFYPAFHRGRFDRGLLLDGLGSRYVLQDASIKPYACCKAGHTAIAAAVEAVEGVDLDPAAVDRIVVHMAGRDTWDILVDPLEVKGDPAALAAPDAVALAQFSLPFMAATAVLRGRLTVEDLTVDARADPQLHALLRRVELREGDATVGVAALPEPGHVEVRLRDGRVLEGRADRAVGHPLRPMPYPHLVDKFRANCAALGAAGTAALLDAVERLDEIEDAGQVTRLTCAG
jgi:2-methylcitrate dehydratase PrpD